MSKQPNTTDDTPEARCAAWGWTPAEIVNRVLGIEPGPVPQLDADGVTVALFERGDIVALVSPREAGWRCWSNGRAASGATVRAAYEAVRS